jgi:hypothetical protein
VNTMRGLQPRVSHACRAVCRAEQSASQAASQRGVYQTVWVHCMQRECVTRQHQEVVAPPGRIGKIQRVGGCAERPLLVYGRANVYGQPNAARDKVSWGATKAAGSQAPPQAVNALHHEKRGLIRRMLSISSATWWSCKACCGRRGARRQQALKASCRRSFWPC